MRGNPALMESALEEMLRWTSPATHAMGTARRDTEIGGHQVRTNRDEEVFPDAGRFHIARAPNPHVTFSHGSHFCIGSSLARLEMRVMFEEIIRRMSDLELAGPVEWLRTNFNCGIKHLPIRFKTRVA